MMLLVGSLSNDGSLSFQGADGKAIQLLFDRKCAIIHRYSQTQQKPPSSVFSSIIGANIILKPPCDCSMVGLSCHTRVQKNVKWSKYTFDIKLNMNF